MKTYTNISYTQAKNGLGFEGHGFKSQDHRKFPSEACLSTVRIRIFSTLISILYVVKHTLLNCIF